MKPSDVYAMPALDSNPWWLAPDMMLVEVFGMREWDIWEKVREGGAKADRVRFERKMSHIVDDEGRDASVYALTLDGKPFGVYVGQHGGDHPYGEFFHTDASAWRDAKSIASQWRSRPKFGSGLSIDGFIPGLEYLPGAGIVRDGDGYRMVDGQFTDNYENMLFDDRLFQKAYAAFYERHQDRPRSEPLLADPAIRREAAEAIRAAVPEGVRAVLVDDWYDYPLDDGGREWIAVVVGTARGAYYITLPEARFEDGPFAWSRNFKCARRDGVWILDNLAERYADRQPAYQPKP